MALLARLSSPEQGWELEARVVNLGLGGACMELGERLTPEARVRLSLDSPSLWDPLHLDGRVAWSDPGVEDQPARVGMKFDHGAGPRLNALVELMGTDGYE